LVEFAGESPLILFAIMISNDSISCPPRGFFALSAVFSLLFVLCACQSTTPPHQFTAEDSQPPLLQLAPGDVIEITFPGATNLTGMRRIGPEGTITMPIVGQIEAGGKTAEQLQQELVTLYAGELRDTNVIVSIAGSGNVIYLEGAVLRPGKITMERPLTAFEAVMEAGGFAEIANKKKVTIIRYKGNENTNIVLNLEPVFTGGPTPPFYLRPRDTVHVPSKMQWF
jgi:polysaccharide export outer membrane protein